MADSEKILQTESSKSSNRRVFGLEMWRGNNGMDKSNRNNKMEYDGFMLRPVFPQDKIDLYKAQTLGPNKEELLTELYYEYSKWLEEAKVICERSGKSLEQYLRRALGSTIKAGRVRDSNNNTTLKLCGPMRTGPDILYFFIKKCPHIRGALLMGVLPAYPWRILQPIEQNKEPAETERNKPLGKLEWIKALLWKLYDMTMKSVLEWLWAKIFSGST